MNGRERLGATLSHQEPDRVCVDFGATFVTGMHVSAVSRLRREVLGDADYRVRVIEPYQMLGEVDDELREAIRALTDGKGVDVVYDPVGGDLAEQAYRSLGWHGRYLVIGFAGGTIPRFAANIALLKEASVIGVWWGTWAMRNPDLARRNMVELSAMVADGKLKPRVTGTYPLDRFADAFAAITERRAQGKIVLTMD